MSQQEFDKLTDAVASLTRRVADLEAEIRAHGDGVAMKRQLRCPSCGHRKILHAERIIADPNAGERYSQPLAATSADTKWYGTSKAMGPFEVFICAACGLSEWYVTEVEVAATKLRVIDGEAPSDGGPFR